MTTRKYVETSEPMGVHQLDRIVYGCGCQVVTGRPYINTWHFCPYHEEFIEQVFYKRRTLWGYVEGSYIPHKHKAACLAELLSSEKAQRAFERRYPKMCRVCWGWGGHAVYDSDTGFTDGDPCHACEEKGLCRLCAAPITDQEHEYLDYCLNCAAATMGGYCSDEAQGMPPSPECYCLDEFGDLEDVPY